MSAINSMKNSKQNYFILLFLAMVWGSSFILMKRGLEVFSYTQVAAIRLFIAFLALSLFLRDAFKKVKKKHIIPIVITGLFGNGIPAFLFTKAQTHLASSFVGILNALTPFFTLLLGIFFFKSHASKTNIFGIALGLAGAYVLASSNLTKAAIEISLYTWMIITATIFYAISVNVIKRYLSDLDSSSIAALAFLCTGPFAGVYILNTNFITLLQTEQGLNAFLYILILALVGTAFAVVIFNNLIRNSSAIFASSVTYLIPIVAIFWGFLDDEEIISSHIIGTITILCGVYLVNRQAKKMV